MKMTVNEIEEMTRSIAHDYDDELSIVGVTAADGEADHAELLITFVGCTEEPCMVQINLPRGDRHEMERALRDRLRAAIAEHKAHTGSAHRP